MDTRIVSIANQRDAEALMRDIGVDKGGIKIMSPKAILNLVRINRLSIIAANILKQETLSLGADTAVSRDVLAGKIKHTDCLIIANIAQLGRLCEKLKMQPYGLSEVASNLKTALTNYSKRSFILQAGRFKLNLKPRTHIMGVVNITTDSFSGDGLCGLTFNKIVSLIEKMISDGADIIDIGGESSRPGANPIDVKEELRRVIPLVKYLSKRIRVPISIDTYKSEVARIALASGASIINDITALRHDRNMPAVVKKYKGTVVLMHMQGSPRNMQKNPKYSDLMGEIIDYLGHSIKIALDAGIEPERIVVDPGIGFGKTLEHNLEIIRRLGELKVLGLPILIGTSRKSFIGKILDCPADERLPGTISSVCAAVMNGSSLVRVHDVKQVRQALGILDRFIC